MIQGLGLTPTELIYVRAMAIRNAGKRYKPVHLIEMIIRILSRWLPHHNAIDTGTNKGAQTGKFFTQEPCPTFPPDNRYSSSDESELSVSWDVWEDNDPLPSQGTLEYTSTVTRNVKNLLQCYVSTQATTQVGSLVGLRLSQSICLQPILAHATVEVTGLFKILFIY